MESFDSLPHPDVEQVSMGHVTAQMGDLSAHLRFEPQETWFVMKDGKRLLFYPDSSPVSVRRHGEDSYFLYVWNENEAYFVRCEAVRHWTSKPQ